MNLLILSRWQFAITVMFHMSFPAITVGLSFLLCILYGLHWKTGNPVYLQMFRFWRRIFAVGFAIGVVAGIVITFQMGLNWGAYAAMTRPLADRILSHDSHNVVGFLLAFFAIARLMSERKQPGNTFACAPQPR